jgi:hypothetical protein
MFYSQSLQIYEISGCVVNALRNFSYIMAHTKTSETNPQNENKFSIKITVFWDLTNIPEEPAAPSSE